MSNDSWPGFWHGRNPVGNGHQRSREVIRHTGGVFREKFPSRKNGETVHTEGLLEGDAVILSEMSPQIVRYGEQAEQVHYPDGAKLRRYTPDFELVLFTGEIILVEVKPSYNLEKEETRHKFHCISEHFARLGKPFVILTEDTLRVALERHWKQFPMPLNHAVPLFRDSGINPVSLLATGLLTCNLQHPVTDDTHLHINEENDNGWFYIAQTHGF